MTFGLKVSTWLLQIADYNWYFLAGGHCGHDRMRENHQPVASH
jgi:hypothetical protein